MTTVYSPAWRTKVRSGAQRSAQQLVPLLIDTFSPTTVVDVGCGEGWFVEQFRAAGITATGMDGPWTDADLTVDFAKDPYPALPPVDLAVCLEVAEHIPARRAPAFVAWLCSLAPTVVFSAALPKQGGTGHVNEQPPAYWARLFAKHGYRGSGALRWQIWDNQKIEPWYRQNLLVFGDHDLPDDRCPYVIHPGIWRMYRR